MDFQWATEKLAIESEARGRNDDEQQDFEFVMRPDDSFFAMVRSDSPYYLL